jgi:hypothetical protein
MCCVYTHSTWVPHPNPLRKKQGAQAWWYMSIVPDKREPEVGGSWSKASIGKNMKSYLKNKLKAKGLWDVAQVLGCLPPWVQYVVLPRKEKDKKKRGSI